MKVEGLAGVVLVVGLALGAFSYRIGTSLSGVGDAVPVMASAQVDGPALFSANCAGCHGPAAQGAVGPKLAGVMGGWPLATFEGAVLDGQSPEGRPLAAMMPHFRSAGFDGEPPSDAQIAAVFTYLKGL
jgi:mono/diheme cytochrome c family protein